MQVAYVVSKYPAVSHTFIAREVRALRRHGTGVTVFSVNAPDPSDVLSAEDAAEADSVVPILGRSSARWLRLVVRELVARPRALRRGLAVAAAEGRGLRGRTWQVFYLLEALVVLAHCRRYDIRHVHAHFANNGADIARMVAEMGRVEDPAWRWSFTMHGPAEFNEVTRFGLQGKSSQADLVVCISDYARSQLMALTAPAGWDRFHVVHCAVQPEAYARRAPLSRRPGELRLLSVGRLVPVKGHHLLLRAVATGVAAGLDLRAVIVGDGPAREDLQRAAVDLGLADRVQFTGSVGAHRVGELLQEVDAFCLPSFQEGVPVVLMEAMASALPVVTTRITGVPELVEHEVNGLLVTPGDQAGLDAAVRRLAQDPELGRRLGQAAVAVVTERFSSDVEAGKLHALVEALHDRD